MAVPYRFVQRLNEGLIRLDHVRHGMQLWHPGKIRRTKHKTLRACEDCHTTLQPGVTVYRPITFAYNRMHRLCEKCIAAKEAGRTSAGGGPCFNCSAPCSDEHLCAGCKAFICVECEHEFPMGFDHSPEDHLALKEEACS